MEQLHRLARSFRIGRFTVCLVITIPSFVLDRVTTEAEIPKYRAIWNPFSHGPILIQAVDIHSAGHFSIRPFSFTKIVEKSYGNQLVPFTEAKPGPVHVYSVQHPFINGAYGLTNHIEVGFRRSVNTFWAKDTTTNNGTGSPWTVNTGLGDTTITHISSDDSRSGHAAPLRHVCFITGTAHRRLVHRNRNSAWRVRPLESVSRYPIRSIGSDGGCDISENFKPFRMSGGAYYTYQVPRSNAGQTTYTPDLINTRLIFEQILYDKTGFGNNLEFK